MYQSAIDDVMSQNQFLVEERVQMFLKQLSQGVQSRVSGRLSIYYSLYSKSCTGHANKRKIGLFYRITKESFSITETRCREREFRETIQIDEVASLLLQILKGRYLFQKH